jgi:hypothetical protein
MSNNIVPSIVSSSETPFGCLVAGPLCEGAAAGPRGRTQTGRHSRACCERSHLTLIDISYNGFPQTLTDYVVLESHCRIESVETIRVPINSARGHDARCCGRNARCGVLLLLDLNIGHFSLKGRLMGICI